MAFKVEKLVPEPGKKINFGAEITGIDLNNISDADIQSLKHLTYTHKFLLIRAQHALLPRSQWSLMCRLDPAAVPGTHADFMADFHPHGAGMLAARGVTVLPGGGNVHLIGKGFQGADHFGVRNKDLRFSFAYENHLPPLPETDLQAGRTRFQGWHFDAPLYGRDPARFTSLRIVRLPQGPDLDVRWDDGSGLSLQAPPGTTPFFSTEQLYEELLTDEERRLVDHSWVEYQAFPYEWNKTCHYRPTGLGIVSEGREMADDEVARMGPDPGKVKRYPMVWLNPHTGRRALQVQSNAARRLFLRTSADTAAPVEVVDDLPRVRAFLVGLQERILRPEYILVPPEREGDVMLWYNWATMHTRVDYPDAYGPKSCHQAAVNASGPPEGPVPLPKGLGAMPMCFQDVRQVPVGEPVKMGPVALSVPAVAV